MQATSYLSCNSIPVFVPLRSVFSAVLFEFPAFHSKITVSACGRIVFAFYFRYTKRYGIETETFDVEESELISMNQKYFDYLREEAPEAAAILQSKSFRSLLHYPRHIYTNTYDHSVRVAICMAWLQSEAARIPPVRSRSVCFTISALWTTRVRTTTPASTAFIIPKKPQTMQIGNSA